VGEKGGTRVSARRAGFLVAIAVAIATIAALATASHVPVADPDDTRGPLDVRRASLHHDDGPPEWTVLTFRTWSTSSIWDSGHVFVFLDTLGSREPDHFVHVGSTGNQLRAVLWRTFPSGGPRDRALRRVAAWRDSKRGASTRVRLRSLTIGPHRTFFRWWVYTSYVGIRCRATCLDRAPNGGSIEQWLPGHSPSPSPTGPSGPSGP
jgi:hypothetical protein